MAIEAVGWYAHQGSTSLERGALPIPSPGPGEVVLKTLACGLCHTDLGYASGKVAPRHPLPLVLGHEIVGTVVEVGEGCADLLGTSVLVPAVMPCGRCAFCAAGRGNACPRQKMPGNDIHGGFATHVLLPGAPLVRLEGFASGSILALSVVADAVSTAWQAVARAGVREGDLVVVVGAGGVGGFAVQIASALGARVIACDVREGPLALAQAYGADTVIQVAGDDTRTVRSTVGALGREWGIPSFRHVILECSGTAAGQTLAYGILGPASQVVFVGYTIDRVSVRLSNLMAYDATAHGTWGCPLEAYPSVLDMVRTGKVKLDPFVEEGPMAEINDYLGRMADHRLERRMVLLPEE
ncbi:6-hydroxycyclohex-1-ene-1-carbonyl-CoA dehydrogenase [Myxococcota bacterium]|nr:6-hydroxycyclohex-1-ene-1-carbonyl-CoA dehydrogenase [Myxococcota bacterium]